MFIVLNTHKVSISSFMMSDRFGGCCDDQARLYPEHKMSVEFELLHINLGM